MKKNIIFLVLFCIVCHPLLAQSLDVPIYTKDKKIPAYYAIPDDAGVIKREKSSNGMETQICQLLKLNKETSLVLRDTLTDVVGGFHETYKQLHNGIEVEGTKCVVHYNKIGIARMISGNLRTIENLDITPRITAEQSKSKAIETIKKDEGLEAFLTRSAISESDDCLVNCTEGTLVVFISNDTPHLAYRHYIQSIIPSMNKRIYIDADTGDFLGGYSTVYNISTSASSVYSDTLSIETQYLNSRYVLRDNTRGYGILTYRQNGSDYESSDNTWSNLSAYDRAAIDAHWGVEKTYDFYYTKFGRNSYDNNGSTITSYVNIKYYDNNGVWTDWPNAGWDSYLHCMAYGRYYNGNPIVCLDVTAHELTHGVTQSTSGLNYEKESGAINEGMSDVFGVCVENEYKTNSEIWKMGEDFITGGLRDLSNPTCKYYQGNGWISTNQTPTDENDYCGVHNNSGVFNYWFYLLAHGGYGSSECNDNYLVEGIGLGAAIQICYLMNAAYLTSDATFSDAMQCSILAAQALGYNDHVICQLYKAWFDVGVNNPGILMLAPSSICNTGHLFIANRPSYFTVNWNVDNSVLSIQSGQGTNHLKVQKVNNGWTDVTATIKYGTEVVKQYSVCDIIVGCPRLGRVDVYNEDLGYVDFSYSGNRLLVDEITDSICDSYEMYLYKGSGNSWVQVGYYSQIYNNGIISYFGSPGFYKVRIRGHNDCCYSDWYETYIESGSNRGERPYNFVYNSDSQNVTIKLLSEVPDYEVQLWNSLSLLKREKTSQSEYCISLQGMKNGVYIVRIIIDGITYTEKIIRN